MTSVFQGLSLSRSVGRVGENPGNEVGNKHCDWFSLFVLIPTKTICKRFEPRSHFKRLSLIVRVNVVLNRTVVVDSDFRVKVSCDYYTLVIDLIGQLCRDVIGRLSVTP